MGLIIAKPEVLNRLRFLFKEQHDYVELPIDDSEAFPIEGHPDVHIFSDGSGLVCSPVVYEALLHVIPPAYQKLMCRGEAMPSPYYPNDVLYNVVSLNQRLFYKSVDSEIQRYLGDAVEAVKVNQGYVKCSTVIVDSCHVITDDENLMKLYRTYDIEVCFVQKGFVKLRGFEYGFIGGASGRIESTIIFNGSLSAHPDGERIRAFVRACQLDILELGEDPLVDCGSIFYLSNLNQTSY